MVAESHRDAGRRGPRRLRRALGPDLPIIVSLDLHGNISQQLADNCNAAVAYRTQPARRSARVRQRAAALMAWTLRGEIRPRMVLVKPPVIVNIMVHDTSRPPLKR